MNSEHALQECHAVLCNIQHLKSLNHEVEVVKTLSHFEEPRATTQPEWAKALVEEHLSTFRSATDRPST